ncbi:MAG: metal ABC transporter permease [Patescibacteria group bacterium]|nr:metal ABC transporter permease [Patescibacteria group bacterium]
MFFYNFLLAGLAGIFISALGVFVVQRRQALIGDSYSHIALPGIAIALLLHFDPLIGALIFLSLSAFLINLIQFKTKIYTETIVGLFFALSLASGILLIPGQDLESILIGNISAVSFFDLGLGLVLVALIIFLLTRYFKDLVFTTFSETLAQAEGINLVKTNLIFLILISLSVTLGVKVAGTLLVASLLIIPAATAQLISQSLKALLTNSIVCGLSTTILGLTLAFIFKVPPGPVIVVFEAIAFLIAFGLKRNRI